MLYMWYICIYVYTQIYIYIYTHINTHISHTLRVAPLVQFLITCSEDSPLSFTEIFLNVKARGNIGPALSSFCIWGKWDSRKKVKYPMSHYQGWFEPKIKVSLNFLFLLLKYSWFTMLCQSPLYSEVTHLYTQNQEVLSPCLLQTWIQPVSQGKKTDSFFAPYLLWWANLSWPPWLLPLGIHTLEKYFWVCRTCDLLIMNWTWLQWQDVTSVIILHGIVTSVLLRGSLPCWFW